jgi:G:T-mismatch repair DNA endonuclease (very short patch repair protein)
VKQLRKEGWKIITVLECRLKAAKLDHTLAALLKKLS